MTSGNIHQDGEYLARVRDVCKDMSLVWPFMFEMSKGGVRQISDSIWGFCVRYYILRHETEWNYPRREYR